MQYAAQKTVETAKDQASAADEQAREAGRLATVYQGLDGGIWKLVEIDYTVNNDPPRINRFLSRLSVRGSLTRTGQANMRWESTFGLANLNPRVRGSL